MHSAAHAHTKRRFTYQHQCRTQLLSALTPLLMRASALGVEARVYYTGPDAAKEAAASLVDDAPGTTPLAKFVAPFDRTDGQAVDSDVETAGKRDQGAAAAAAAAVAQGQGRATAPRHPRVGPSPAPAALAAMLVILAMSGGVLGYILGSGLACSFPVEDPSPLWTKLKAEYNSRVRKHAGGAAQPWPAGQAKFEDNPPHVCTLLGAAPLVADYCQVAYVDKRLWPTGVRPAKQCMPIGRCLAVPTLTKILLACLGMLLLPAMGALALRCEECRRGSDQVTAQSFLASHLARCRAVYVASSTIHC